MSNSLFHGLLLSSILISKYPNIHHYNNTIIILILLLLLQVLLDVTRVKMDEMAEKWSEEEKTECLEQTLDSFKYGGSLMSYMRDPDLQKANQ